MLISILVIIQPFILSPTASAVTQNLTEHSWIYSQGYIDDMRIYQTDSGFHGQKVVTGTRGTGTVSRTIDSRVYGGFEHGYDEISMSEWGVYQNRPSAYTTISTSDLKNALCAKNYEVGSVISESYSDLIDLVKDTRAIQTDEVSVYDIHSEVQGTAKVGARVQRTSSAAPAYVMSGTYTGYTNMYIDLETGNASILTLPCP